MANDTPISKKYRIWNEGNNEWDRISFWTKGSDVHYDNDTVTSQDLMLNNMLLRNKEYSYGDAVFEKTAKPCYMFRCEMDGTTAATTPSGYANASTGDVITDGDARFRAYDISPSSDGSSAYKTASLKSVKDIRNQIVDTDGTPFYFGMYDGNYGFYTSADKSSSSFHLFKNDYTFVIAIGRMVPDPSVTIRAGQTGSVYLLPGDWEDVWIIEEAYSTGVFYVRYKIQLLDGTYKDGWITVGADTAFHNTELISCENGWATFKNNNYDYSVTITPGYIWGYLRS